MSFLCPLCSSNAIHPYFDDRRRAYFQCEHCSLVFVDPQQRLTAEQEKAEYDLHQNKIDDKGYRVFLNRLYQPMLEHLPAGASGLDFGCGSGPALSMMFKEAGFETAIYDPFYCNDESVLNAEYDFITATEVVEHIYQPNQVILNLWRCLKVGGVLGLMTKMVIDKNAFSKWHYKNDPTHVCFYSDKTFRYLADELKAELIIAGPDVILLVKMLDSEKGLPAARPA